LVAAREEKRIGGDQERRQPVLRSGFESGVDLAVGAGAQDVKLQTSGARRLLYVSQLDRRRGEVRVQEHAERRRLRHQLA
jgi:hypothetical protein